MPIFRSLAEKHAAPLVFKYMYNFVFGNVLKKDLEFEEVLAVNFENGILLEQLIEMVEVDKKLSPQNAK